MSFSSRPLPFSEMTLFHRLPIGVEVRIVIEQASITNDGNANMYKSDAIEFSLMKVLMDP